MDSEIAQGTSKDSKSCTVGLLWLKRYDPYHAATNKLKEPRMSKHAVLLLLLLLLLFLLLLLLLLLLCCEQRTGVFVFIPGECADW